MNDLTIQIIGIIGVFFFMMSYQVKSNKMLFFMQIAGCFVFCVQLGLLGAYSGCMSLVVLVVRNIMLTRYEKWEWVRWKGWAIIFSLILVAITIMTWDGPVSILPGLGAISGTLACWTNNAKIIRITNLTINSPCCLIYDVIFRSWGGVINESITIISIIVSIMRFGWKALDGDRVAEG